ncbi:hypothetical protein L1987_63352 [Smallanthus sonchifolius]|uniref:Uncharacterized protein n=1 Tax=Smallanthus sonchifolius TaxID=185202 RepID=A0ACB9CD97_9ASTR|nr:hypothetical protein L1987_63352 [Smallanthus sonchifolius]
MTALLNPHLLSLFLLLPLFFISLPAQSNNSTFYPNCPSYDCGGVTIRYPFWNNEIEPTTQFCGYEGFQMNCYNNASQRIPSITLGDHYYYVRSINYELKNILVADYDISVILNPINCPRVRSGINLQTSPLNFSMSTIDLSFHFSCNGCPSFATEIPCFGIIGRKSCVHIMNMSREETDWGEYSCTQEVVTTVLRDNINRFPDLSTEFGRVLEGGFELEWRTTDDCNKCEESNGRCGHDYTTGFICLCSDGTTRKDHCKGDDQNLRRKLRIGSALLSLVIILIIYCTLKPLSSNCVASLKHKTKDEKDIEIFVTQYGSLSTKRYKYSDIKKMTNSFKVKLGQGGFGQVFKGKLPDGRLVAVKVLNTSKANGQEFINEVASIGRTSHVNIVTLLGFCFNYQKRALVYEYMPNGSLEKFIHSHVPMESSENIGIKKLYEIALGIACGLDYLHRGCKDRILHLDIKPHNILLDEEFCPKIADFGLAKLYSRKESIVSMFEARGTIGYIAPEVYNKNFGGVSHKSDVYSYGMLLLEMVGGRKNVDAGVGSGRTSEIYFPDWIYKRLHKEEFLLDSVKTTEENDYARKMTIIGLWCIQPVPNQRPSIDEVIEMLEGSMEALKVPPKPIFSSPPRSVATISSTLESMPEST